MRWIVLGEKQGRIELVSKSDVNGMLPRGSFLTIEEGEIKFVLRVDDSHQHAIYSPSPMIVDMDLSALQHDRLCKNIISAYRVYTIGGRSDGLIEYVRPQSIARLSDQNEIDVALGSHKSGPKVFVATVQYEQNQLLKDNKDNYITATLPDDMFFHQVLVCGKTGSGKTVSIKYLSQYFVEEYGGAVLAINVKDVDLLKMDKPTETIDPLINKEWNCLNRKPHGIEAFSVYYPANTEISVTKGVTKDVCNPITLDVTAIEPESLTGLLQNISDIGAMNFPNIFRWWQEDQKKKGNENTFKFRYFVDYFRLGEEDNRSFSTLNTRGETSEVTLHKGTFDNIVRNLDVALDFFDNKNAHVLNEEDILVKGKMSIIDVASKNGIQFGSIILRELLHQIVAAKSEKRSEVPILIIIDEVHVFYNNAASTEALGDLDTICRTGRSQGIGVIFSSQNPQDIPKGLFSVINTKIFFRSDAQQAKYIGTSISSEEIEGLKRGYAVANIHDMSSLKILKFPLSYSGV